MRPIHLNRGVRGERDSPFVGETDVRHAGDIGDRWPAEREPVLPRKMRLDEGKDALRLFSRAHDIEL